MLYRAGITVQLAKFLTISAAAALLALAPLLVVLHDFLTAAMLAGLVGLAPWLLVWQRQRSRKKLIEQQLIGALELMSRALRAGRSVTGSFRIVGEESPDPIGAEFGQLANEIQLGLDLRRALTNLGRRVNSDYIRFFNTAVLIQRDAGGNLAELVDNLSQLIRERMDFQGKVSALTAQAAMASNMLLLIVVGLMSFLYVKNPTFLEPLWTTPEGMKMARIGIGLIAVGYVLGRRMARITV
jgi:tight adherence protein B